MNKALYSRDHHPNFPPIKEKFDFSTKQLCPYYPCADKAAMCATCVPPRDELVAKRRYIPCCRLDLLPGAAPKGGRVRSAKTPRGDIHGSVPSGSDPVGVPPGKAASDSEEVGFLIDVAHLKVKKDGK